MWRTGLAVLAASLLAFGGPSMAQIASLAANSIEVDAEGRLTAEGDVEVFYEGTRLTARRVTYDRRTDRLAIEGPLVLYDGEGGVVIGSSAELDPQLANGVLRSARLVLDQQLQLASARLDRVDGRFTQLNRVVASSCELCPGQRAPLWEIRARTAIHDEQERQLYFTNAQIRVAGVPVFFTPSMRLPDPTVDRNTGFLVPRIRSSTRLGTGLQFPYFIAVSDSTDLTLSPYLSASTTTLEARYRQRFRQGRLTFEGAYTTRDDVRPGDDRAYLFGSGGFNLPNDYRLNFDIELVSDTSYLSDYDYSDKDRLDSAISLRRTRDDEQISGALTFFRTLRPEELRFEQGVPNRLGEFEYTRRLPTGALGGDAWLTLDALALNREANLDILGRNVIRAGATAAWRRDWLLPQGALFALDSAFSLDVYGVENDSRFGRSVNRATPQLAAELRWPLIRREPGGVTQTLEPVAQLAWAESFGEDAPNEDSRLVEFDEGNLFALSRFPGSDRYEEGLRANLGLTWWRRDPGRYALGVTVGRILRFDAPDQFAQGTGLDDDLSDWLAVARLRMGPRFSAINRALFDDRLEFTRNETRLDWSFSEGLLSTSYTWSDEIPAENRDRRISEWSLDARYDFSRNWRGRVSWRYDLVERQAARAGLGIRYQNECLGVDFSASRRFTSSSNVTPITDFDVRVSVTGFGTNAAGQRFRRVCAG